MNFIIKYLLKIQTSYNEVSLLQQHGNARYRKNSFTHSIHKLFVWKNNIFKQFFFKLYGKLSVNISRIQWTQVIYSEVLFVWSSKNGGKLYVLSSRWNNLLGIYDREVNFYGLLKN